MNTPGLTLRRLEMAMPLMDKAQKQEADALVQLAALCLADEQTLKLSKSGNTEAMAVYVERAYDMEAEAIAETLGFFIKASQRFSLRLAGLSPEEVQAHMTKTGMNLRTSLGIESPAESPQS